MFLFINKTYIYWSCTLLYICSSLKDICTLPQSFIFLFFQTDDEPKSGISLLLHIPTPGRQRKWPVLFFLWRKNSIYQGLFLHNINKACMPWGFVTVWDFIPNLEKDSASNKTLFMEDPKTSIKQACVLWWLITPSGSADPNGKHPQETLTINTCPESYNMLVWDMLKTHVCMDFIIINKDKAIFQYTVRSINIGTSTQF